jgi:hypothetical protein
MEEKIRCTKCGKILNPKRMITLEFNQRTGEWNDPNKVTISDPHDSQGCWNFGPDCAKDPEFGEWLSDPNKKPKR